MSTSQNEYGVATEVTQTSDKTVKRSVKALPMRALRKLVMWEYFPITAVIILFVILNCLLVFNSPYQTFLDSDMGGYYNKPFQIFQGNEKGLDNWVGFAPYYPRILAVELTWLNYFHLDGYFLEFVLLQNIALSALAILALYFIGMHITGRKAVAFALAAVYGLSYPHLYYNVFVLTEPFVVPLIIISIWMLHAWRNSYKITFCGLLLATAVGVRPSTGLLGLPFGLYILFAGISLTKIPVRDWIKVMWPRVLKAAAFSAAFFFVVFTIMAENNRISNGLVRGLTSHSGYNFLLGQAQAHKIVSTWDGITYIFVPPSVAHHPENGTIYTDIPIYDSKRFYEEGWKILKAYPRLWLEHFAMYPSLFFDNLFPATDAVPGFPGFFDPFRYIAFYMFVLGGLVYIALKERDVHKCDVALYVSIFFISCASLYMYTVTHTYFFDFSYTVYVVFAMTAYGAIRHFKKYKKLIVSYTGIVLVLTGAFWTYKALAKIYIDKNIRVAITQNQEPIRNLDQTRIPVKSENIDVDKLEFYLHWHLQHSTLGHLDYFEQFFMDADTEMEVLKSGNYLFTFFVNDGYEVFLDGQQIMGYNGIKEMDQYQIRTERFLTKGSHRLEVKMFQAYGESGLTAYYRRLDETPRPEGIIFEPKGGRGEAIGVDDQFTRFNYPSWQTRTIAEIRSSTGPASSEKTSD